MEIKKIVNVWFVGAFLCAVVLSCVFVYEWQKTKEPEERLTIETEHEGNLTPDERKVRQVLERKSSKTTEKGLTEEERTQLLRLRYIVNNKFSLKEALERVKLEIKSSEVGEGRLTGEQYKRLQDLRQKAKKSSPLKN